MNVRCNHGRFSRAWRARGLVRRAPHVAPATVQAASLLSLAMPCTTPAAAGVNAGVTNTLHAHVLADHPHPAGPGPRRRGLFVDCETTGFDHGRDQVIELAMLPFVYTLEGAITDTPAVRIWAVGAPFETKDELRARGYRWMPTERDGARGRGGPTSRRPSSRTSSRGSPASTGRTDGSSAPTASRDATLPRAIAGALELRAVAMHDIGETAHAIRATRGSSTNSSPRSSPSSPTSTRCTAGGTQNVPHAHRHRHGAHPRYPRTGRVNAPGLDRPAALTNRSRYRIDILLARAGRSRGGAFCPRPTSDNGRLSEVGRW